MCTGGRAGLRYVITKFSWIVYKILLPMVLRYKIQVFENVEGCFANMRYIPVSLNLRSFLPWLYIINQDQIYPWPNPHRVFSGHQAMQCTYHTRSVLSDRLVIESFCTNLRNLV